VSATTAAGEGAPTLSILEPMELGPLRAKNRIWMTAHATHLTVDHNFSQAHADYYGERAKGGVAVITLEASAVHPTSQPADDKVLAYQDAVASGYQRVLEAVSPHGTIVLAQLWHRGRQTSSLVSRLPVWAPSAVPCPVYGEMPKAMTRADIAELIQGYVRSAEIAIDAGMHGVEVHGAAHGYILNQFLSPATNHRTDEYGGTLQNRLRIVRDVLLAVREVVPGDRIMGMRINGDDGAVEGGLDNSAWAEIAEQLSGMGVLDYLSVSMGTYADRMEIYAPTPKRAGYQLQATARIRRHAQGLPVVAVGRISSPEMAESIVTTGTADFVGMARQLIADPEWVSKVASGRSDSIRPCVGANWCVSTIGAAPLACVHNPAVGRERALGSGTLSILPEQKRVAVVGGGPAGLRSAVTAASRGARVTLFERTTRLGGQVALMARAPSYREWAGITDWLAQEADRLQVEVRLSAEATAPVLLDEGFDAVIVATGARPLRHGWSAIWPARWNGAHGSVPGTDQWNVFSAFDVLEGTANLLRNVLIIDDLGDRTAAAVAECLARDHHQVTLATRHSSPFARLVASQDQGLTVGRLKKLGVTVMTDVVLTRISEDRAELQDVHTRARSIIEPADSVVLVHGNESVDDLSAQLRESSIVVLPVGDCVAPRNVFDAIWEGELAARTI
jgi:2,4-dienoyl-CoA reductase-like NADH-dependent reductase (Old Yellow Enzyme family)